MMKFTRSTKKKLDKVRSSDRSSSRHGGGGGGGDRSVASAYSAHSNYSDYTEGNSTANGGGGGGRSRRGPRGGNRFSSAQSVTSVSSASIFAPSVVSGVGGGGGGLQPSSARLLKDLNSSARSSLLSSLGTAASRTFRSYKMTLPRCPPPVKNWNGSTSSGTFGGSSGAIAGEESPAPPVETDLELLGRTVHAVSSALTEPPREGDRYMIYDVSFNPKGCVWDALIVVTVKDGEGDGDDDGSRSSSRMGRRSSRSKSRQRGSSVSSNRLRSRSSSSQRRGSNASEDDGNTFTFPIRVTCAEDDDVDDEPPPQPRRGMPTPPPRAKTYAVDLSVIDDSVHHPISRWSNAEAAEHRDDIKDAMEWVSFGIRRSMARSMFPQFPEGCQGKAFREIYQLNKKLKSGTFSTVCRGVHRATGRQVAVKCILRKKIEPSVDAAVFEEVLIMSGMHHKFICPMIDYFEEDRCHFVVMELEKGGDLCERLNDKVTYSEPDAKTVTRNICEAMEFVHSNGFAHCDIKPRNYLLRSKRDDVDIRLADFGFAQHVHAPNSLTSQCGTPFFVAPEVINRKPYDQKVDMWSIGVTTYLLLCGDTPFNGKNRQQLFRRISCDEPAFPDEKWGHISDEALDFVKRLLTKDPARRLSAKQALEHRWLAVAQPQGVTNGHASAASHQEVPQEPYSPQQPSHPSSAAPGVSPGNKSRSSRGRGSRSVAGGGGDPPPARKPSRSRERNKEKERRASKSRERTSSSRGAEQRDRSDREGKNRSSRSSRSQSKGRSGSKVRSGSKGTSTRSRSKSGSRPPPPPMPQSIEERSGDVSSTSDENARLLDVIKDQDAKIEKLERMVKMMLNPEGSNVHQC